MVWPGDAIVERDDRALAAEHAIGILRIGRGLAVFLDVHRMPVVERDLAVVRRLSTHAEPESCWPPHTRYGNEKSALTWYIAAVFWLYQLLQLSPRLADTTPP